MKYFSTTVTMEKTLFEQANRLLAIEDFEDLKDDELEELGGETNDRKELFSVTFENGTTIQLLLVSGSHNYYTTPEIITKSGRAADEDSAGFELSKQEVFTAEDSEYTIDITLI